ncbi:MAG: dihydroorotate dehydrogenase [Pseudorhodobacter sp.]
MDERDLDDLLHEARIAPRPPAPAHLTDRILAGALSLQPGRPEPATARQVRRPPSLWQSMLAAIGGGQALAGLSTAAVAGLWLGLAAPAPVAALTETVWPGQGLDLVELLPDDVEFLEEG